jgi:predicted site-specific integrase-resolvase
MSELLTAAELATDLKMSQQVVLRWHRAGRIKAELLIGRSPRFDSAKVRKQLAKASDAAAARKFSGMVPTL